MTAKQPFEGGAENPFRAPVEPQGPFQYADGERIRQSGRFVRHISIVSTLMIINSVLMLIAGVCVTALAFVFRMVPEMEEELDAAMINWLSAVYAGVGAVILTIGFIQLVAGIRNLDFRSRKFGIFALLTGLASIFTVYCAPTSIGLTVYGLVVYFNPEVEQAFRLRGEGLTKEEVLTKMNV